jgi:hypothetical protein
LPGGEFSTNATNFCPRLIAHHGKLRLATPAVA